MSDEKDWNPSPVSVAATRVTLDRIDEAHAHLPACAFCGQHVITLDKTGLCSKTSVPREEFRAEVRAGKKAGAR